jgi:hypothetical protein
VSAASIILLAAIASAFFAGVIIAVVKALRAPGARRWAALPFGVLVFYGFGAFFLQAAAGAGALASVPASVEFPVWRPDAQVRGERGLTFVGLGPIGRIQVYDEGGRFLRGWFVPARGGAFTIQPAPGGRIVVAITRGRQKLCYDADGRIAEADRSPAALAATIVSDRPPIDVAWHPVWWPLASPFVAWLVGAVGGVGLGWLARTGRPRAR